MRKQNGIKKHRRAIAVAVTILTLLCLVGTTRIVVPTHAATRECITVISGNGDEGTLDSVVQFLNPNTNTFENAFIIPPHTDNDGQPPDTNYAVINNTHYVAVSADGHGTEQADHKFKANFNLPAAFTNPSFSIQVHCDNQATIFLNGNNLGSQPFAEDIINFQDPAEVFSTTNPAHFVPGTNVLEITAHNFTDRIALDFRADICFDTGTQVTCGACDEGVVIVDQNTTIDLNPAVPTCSGDPDLCAFFTFDKSGPSPSTWKAKFNLGAKKLVVTNNATISVVPGPPNGGNNKEAPGIEITTTCEVQIDQGASVVVQSINKQAGDILIKADSNVTINGTVSNSVTGTNGRPGDITIASCCGDIVTGSKSLIQTIGVDHGGSDINLLACDGGDITINGLVDASYKGESAATINIAAIGGAVTIDGNNSQGIEAGTQRPITSGVTVRSRRDPLAGKIVIQALNDVTVLGNRILDKVHPNYGAVAVKPTSTNGSSGDGSIFAESLEGRIVASDRAFDIANRFNGLNDLTLLAKGNIELSVTAAIDNGAVNNTKAVVNSQGGSAGKGGNNGLRSYSGQIQIGVNAQVLANFVGTPGTNGTNAFTTCGGVVNNGTVLPPATVGVACAPPGPTPVFTGCAQFNIGCGVSNPEEVCLDAAPPTVSCSVTTTSLWPPNHDLANVGLTASVTDDCDSQIVIGGGPGVNGVAVYSDEQDLDVGSGNFSPDAKNIGLGTLRLRSERGGPINGRVYLIVVQATDASGKTGYCVKTVTVPHDQSNASKNSVAAQAAAASAFFLANHTPPPTFVQVGVGPVVGPKQ